MYALPTPYEPDEDILVPGTDLKVHDADTFNGMRLVGINAPEMYNPHKGTPRQHMAREATQAAAEFLGRGDVSWDTMGKGLYGRPLVDAQVGDQSLSEYLLRQGLANPAFYQNLPREMQDQFDRAFLQSQVDYAKGRSPYQEQLDNGPRANVELDGKIKYKPNGMLVDALQRGTDQLQGSLYGAAHTAARALGAEDLAQWAKQGVERNEYEASLNPARYASYKDIKGIGDVLPFAAEKAVESLPQMLPFAAGGLAGLAGKTALGKLGFEVSKTAAARTGALALGTPGHMGEIENEQMQLAADRQASPFEVMAAGVVRAGLDVFGMEKALGNVLGETASRSAMDIAKNVLKGIGAGALAEAPTEAAQEAIAIGLRAAHDPEYDPFGTESIERLKESFIAGGAAGGFTTGIGRGAKAVLDYSGEKMTAERPQQEPAKEDSESADPGTGDPITDNPITSDLINRAMEVEGQQTDDVTFTGVDDLVEPEWMQGLMGEGVPTNPATQMKKGSRWPNVDIAHEEFNDNLEFMTERDIRRATDTKQKRLSVLGERIDKLVKSGDKSPGVLSTIEKLTRDEAIYMKELEALNQRNIELGAGVKPTPRPADFFNEVQAESADPSSLEGQVKGALNRFAPMEGEVDAQGMANDIADYYGLSKPKVTGEARPANALLDTEPKVEAQVNGKSSRLFDKVKNVALAWYQPESEKIGLSKPVQKWLQSTDNYEKLRGFETVAHEIGHHAIESKLAEADSEVQAQLDIDYAVYLKEFEARTANEAAAGRMTILRGLRAMQNPDFNQEYALDKKEWLADQAAQYLTEPSSISRWSKGTQGIIRKIAQMMSRLIQVFQTQYKGHGLGIEMFFEELRARQEAVLNPAPQVKTNLTSLGEGKEARGARMKRIRETPTDQLRASLPKIKGELLVAVRQELAKRNRIEKADKDAEAKQRKTVQKNELKKGTFEQDDGTTTTVDKQVTPDERPIKIPLQEVRDQVAESKQLLDDKGPIPPNKRGVIEAADTKKVREANEASAKKQSNTAAKVITEQLDPMLRTGTKAPTRKQDSTFKDTLAEDQDANNRVDDRKNMVYHGKNNASHIKETGVSGWATLRPALSKAAELSGHAEVVKVDANKYIAVPDAKMSVEEAQNQDVRFEVIRKGANWRVRQVSKLGYAEGTDSMSEPAIKQRVMDAIRNVAAKASTGKRGVAREAKIPVLSIDGEKVADSKSIDAVSLTHLGQRHNGIAANEVVSTRQVYENFIQGVAFAMQYGVELGQLNDELIIEYMGKEPVTLAQARNNAYRMSLDDTEIEANADLFKGKDFDNKQAADAFMKTLPNSMDKKSRSEAMKGFWSLIKNMASLRDIAQFMRKSVGLDKAKEIALAMYKHRMLKSASLDESYGYDEEDTSVWSKHYGSETEPLAPVSAESMREILSTAATRPDEAIEMLRDNITERARTLEQEIARIEVMLDTLLLDKDRRKALENTANVHRAKVEDLRRVNPQSLINSLKDQTASNITDLKEQLAKLRDNIDPKIKAKKEIQSLLGKRLKELNAYTDSLAGTSKAKDAPFITQSYLKELIAYLKSETMSNDPAIVELLNSIAGLEARLRPLHVKSRSNPIGDAEVMANKSEVFKIDTQIKELTTEREELRQQILEAEGSQLSDEERDNLQKDYEDIDNKIRSLERQKGSDRRISRSKGMDDRLIETELTKDMPPTDDTKAFISGENSSESNDEEEWDVDARHVLEYSNKTKSTGARTEDYLADTSVPTLQKTHTPPSERSVIENVEVLNRHSDSKVVNFLRELANLVGLRTQFYIIDEGGKAELLNNLEAKIARISKSADNVSEFNTKFDELRTKYESGELKSHKEFNQFLHDAWVKNDEYLDGYVRALRSLTIEDLKSPAKIDKVLSAEFKNEKALRSQLQRRINALQQSYNELSTARSARIIYNDASPNVTDRLPFIYLPSKGVSTNKQITRAAHELGHLIKRSVVDQLIRKATDADSPDADAQAVVKALFGGVNWSDYTQALVQDEKFANMMVKWALTSKKPRTLVEKFFSDLGKLLRKVYEKAKSMFKRNAQETGQFESFSEFMDAMVANTEGSKFHIKEVERGRKATFAVHPLSSAVSEQTQKTYLDFVRDVVQQEFLPQNRLGASVHHYTGQQTVDYIARSSKQFRNWGGDKPILGSTLKAMEFTGKVASNMHKYVGAVGVAMRNLNNPAITHLAKHWHIMPGEAAPKYIRRVRVGKGNNPGQEWFEDDVFMTIPEEMRKVLADLEPKMAEILSKVPHLSGMDYLSSDKRKALVAKNEALSTELLEYTSKQRDLKSLSPLAKDIVGYMDTLYGYFTNGKHKLYLQHRVQYYPEVIDEVKWAEKSAEIIGILMSSEGMTHEQATSYWRHVWATKMLDPNLDITDMSAASMRNRFRRQASLDTQRLFIELDVYSHDVHDVITTITHQMAKRSIEGSRFGGFERDGEGNYIYQKNSNGELIKDDKGNPKRIYNPMQRVSLQLRKLQENYTEGNRGGLDPESLLRVVEKYLPALRGTLGSDISPEWNSITSWTMTGLNIMLLPLAVLSSVTDLAGMAMMKERYKSPFGALNDFRKMARLLVNSPERVAAERLARQLGSVQDRIVASALSDSTAIDSMIPTTRKLNENFFGLIQMKRFTDFTRIMATEFATDHFREIAEKLAKGENIGDALKEYSANEGELISWYNNGARVDDVINYPSIAGSVARWTDFAVLRPSASNRPPVGSDARFRLFFHLKGFMYEFYYTTMYRAFNQVGHMGGFGKMVPLLALAAFVLPLTMIGYELRKLLAEEMMGGIIGRDPRYKKPEGFDYFEEMVTRGGLLGPFTILHDMYDAEAHGSLALTALMGPAVTKSVEFFDKDFETFLINSTPVLAQSRVLRDAAKDALSDE